MWVPLTLRGYRTSWFGADAFAGLTLVAVAVPSQMATARLANLPAVDGLYAFIVGSLFYALLGSNPHVSVGADSTIVPVLVAGAAAVAAVGTREYATVMALLALLAGAVLLVVGFLRLGWISDFLSTPVIAGILAGIAVEIMVRQIPAILGVTAGGSTTMGRVSHVFDQRTHINVWSAGIAVGALALMVAGQRVDRRLPGALVALALSVIAVEVLHLASRHGVAVVGAVHGGVPRISLPSATWNEFRRLVGPVLTVAFLCIAQTAATVRGSRAGTPAADDFNRDLIGVGAGCVAAGMIGTFAVDASPPNTAIVASSGSRSQLTNATAAAIVALVIGVATAPLSHVPDAVLGATLVFIAAKLVRIGELSRILAFDRTEFALALTALLVVALVGIEQGVVVALILCLADRTRRAARPRDTLLGREPGTDHWISVEVGRPTEQVLGVIVYLVYAPLWYGNADLWVCESASWSTMRPIL